MDSVSKTKQANAPNRASRIAQGPTGTEIADGQGQSKLPGASPIESNAAKEAVKPAPKQEVTPPTSSDSVAATTREPAPGRAIPARKRLPTISKRGSFHNPLRNGNKLYAYDFDLNQQLPNCMEGDADFFFRPDSIYKPDTRIAVYPCAPAQYAPQFAGHMPWEIRNDEYITRGQKSAGPSNSVAQEELIPCRTSAGFYCQFSLKLDANGELTISYVVYNSR